MLFRREGGRDLPGGGADRPGAAGAAAAIVASHTVSVYRI